VTYVSSANNYKQWYLDEQSKKQAAESKSRADKETLATKSKQFEDDLKARIAEIADLKQQMLKLDSDMKSLNRALTTANQKAANSTALAKTAGEVSEGLQKDLKSQAIELKQALARVNDQEQRLEEVSSELITKIAVINTLQAEKRRLEEARTQLQVQLDRLLGRSGIKIRQPGSVTQLPGTAQPAPPTAAITEKLTKPIALKGSITEVNLENSFVQISIGSVNGVRKDMRFIVTRGNQFICEILIFDVVPEMAVGVIERLKSGATPKIGDNVATNL
jgi:hypothetical protein